MFGLIVSGRLVQTDAQQVEETKFMFTVPEIDSVNHVVIFLTGQVPFPQEYGAAVYFSFPNPQGQSWQLLGHISNNKPSVIFKITKLKQEEAMSHPFGQFGAEQSHMAQIGISVEPLSILSQQTPVSEAMPSSVQPFVEFSTKMLENFFNYASSFATNQMNAANMGDSYIPLSTLKNWFETFQRRLQQNPYFWRS